MGVLLALAIHASLYALARPRSTALRSAALSEHAPPGAEADAIQGRRDRELSRPMPIRFVRWHLQRVLRGEALRRAKRRLRIGVLAPRCDTRVAAVADAAATFMSQLESYCPSGAPDACLCGSAHATVAAALGPARHLGRSRAPCFRVVLLSLGVLPHVCARPARSRSRSEPSGVDSSSGTFPRGSAMRARRTTPAWSATPI